MSTLYDGGSGQSSSRTASLKEVETATGVVFNGEAFRIRVTAVPQVMTSTEDWRLILSQAASVDFNKPLKKSFDSKYQVDRVSSDDTGIVLRVCAKDVFLSGGFLQSSPGASWLSTVDAYAEGLRRTIRDLLKKDRIGANSLIAAEWELGSGVTVTSGAIDPDAPDRSLHERLRELRQRERSMRPRQLLATAVPVVGSVIGGLVLLVFDRVLGLAIIGYTVPFVLILPLVSSSRAAMRDEISEINARLDLRELLTPEERGAHKLFQVNSLELKRYYDQGLRQRSLVFILGVLCLIMGFAAVAASFFIIATGDDAQLSEKITVAALGGVSGVLANFVAVIFLRMFSQTVQSIVDFHNRLVITQHVHFGNVLAAKITDEDLREDTLSRMALALAKLDMPPEKADQASAVDDRKNSGRETRTREGGD